MKIEFYDDFAEATIRYGQGNVVTLQRSNHKELLTAVISILERVRDKAQEWEEDTVIDDMPRVQTKRGPFLPKVVGQRPGAYLLTMPIEEQGSEGDFR